MKDPDFTDRFYTRPNRSFINLHKKITSCVKACFYLILLIPLSQNLHAATQLDSKGTDFWLMFTTNYQGTPALTLFVTGDTATTGTVSIPGLSFTTSFTVTPGTVTSVVLPSSAQATTYDATENLGIHVSSLAEVTVYGLNRIQYSTDAFLGLPTDILGKEYINLGYSGGYDQSEFGIVAVEDNTVVTITPTETVGIRNSGISYSVSLNQGQTYQLRTTNQGDLTGTIIKSDKPIAAFGGHQCANVPSNARYCDYLVEQLTPASTWGQSFLTVPLATRTKGDTFRILASQDGTQVSINGSIVATLNRGEFDEQVILGQSQINATKPVLVAQYSNGTTFDNVTSDPFESLVPPTEQFLAGYTVTTPASGFAINYITVVAPNSVVGAVNLDGTPIPSGSFLPIGSSGFSGTKIPVTLGSHTLASSLPFGVTSYGFDTDDSYGYPGGLALGQVASITKLTISPKTATNPINTQHCVTGTTKDQNSKPLPGIRVDFEVNGVHSTDGFIFTNSLGNAEFCYTGVKVGTDTITASVGNLFDTATKTWTNTQVPRCDVNGDGLVNKTDINLIMSIKNKPASGTTDPRDADGNGTINANDARQCTLKCTSALCK